MMALGKFLLIDDDQDDWFVFQEALSRCNAAAEVHFCGSGEEGLVYLAENQPDIIFLDINMPLMTGWEFLTEYKKLHPHSDVPIVMYSTTSNQQDKVKASELGAACFIVKPDRVNKLRDLLDSLISAGENLTDKLQGLQRV